MFAAKSILCGTAVQEGRGETRKEEDERNGNVYIDETCGMNCITNGMKWWSVEWWNVPEENSLYSRGTSCLAHFNRAISSLANAASAHA